MNDLELGFTIGRALDQRRGRLTVSV